MIESVDRTFKAPDGTELPVRVWWPEGRGAVPSSGGTEKGTVPVSQRQETGAAPFLAPPRAALVYLHGIQSHAGWYEASSRRMAEAGVAVYQVDRRGSGRDQAHERGHIDRAETWLEDVAAAAELARAETGVPSVHLMGVSWGGKLALACGAHRPDLYRSLILSAPGIFPMVDVVFMAKVRVIQCLLGGQPLRRFQIPLGDPGLFTADTGRQRYIAGDPLSLHEITARFMFESRRLDRLARRAARTVRLPVFLALAEADRIIDNAATRRLFYADPRARVPPARRRLRVYPGTHHTLDFEAAPEAYFEDLVAWIREVEAAP